MEPKLICLKCLTPMIEEDHAKLREGLQPLVEMGYQIIMVPSSVEVSSGDIAFGELKNLVSQIELGA